MNYKLNSEYIELFRLLKAAQLCESGGEAKILISEGLVTVNGEVELRKRFKVRPGHLVEFDGQHLEVE